VLLVVLLVLGAGLVAADLVASGVAERSIAQRVQQSGGLPERPEVEVRGRPFLLQALRGRYDDVVVRSAEVPAGQLGLSDVVTELSGVRVPLRQALSSTSAPVPVQSVRTRGVVSYEALTATVADRGLRVGAAEAGLVRVTGGVQVLGRTLEASAVSRPELVDGGIVVTAERFEVGSPAADALLTRGLGDRLDFRVDVAQLPFGLALTSLRAGADGVTVTAEATDTVLTP
jgi:hypothetical protein